MAFVHHHAPQATPTATDLCLVIQGDRLLTRPEAVGPVLPDFAALAGWREVHGAPLHVGLIEGKACWLCGIDDAEVAAPEGWAWAETRTVLTTLTSDELHAISCARQLYWWDRRHRFCGVCGTPLADLVEERARRCPQCRAVYFPVASPAVIVAVTRGDQLLLAHNRNFRPGMFSLLAGFVDPGETLEQAVAREIREEVAIEVEDIRYVASQPWPFPNSLMLGFRARYAGGEIRVDGKEIEQADWYRKSALPDLPRAGTIARQMIEQWRNDAAGRAV